MAERRPRNWAKYIEAIEFIALNLQPTEMREEYVADQDMVILACELFHRTPEDVAKTIIQMRTSLAEETGPKEQLTIWEEVPVPDTLLTLHRQVNE